MSGVIDTAFPTWWPKGEEWALLDQREKICRVFHWSQKDGGTEWSEPAYLRLDADGLPIAWGRRAQAWLERESPARAREVFPQGWPQDSILARRYLERFAQTYLTSRRRWKVYLTEEQERRWTRRLWQESLEDSSFQIAGFLLPWQHDLAVASCERPELALENHIHLALEEGAIVWRFLRRGDCIASGREASLSRHRLYSLISEHARRHLQIETAEGAISDLLATTGLNDSRSAKSLPLTLSGRHLPSGLPTRADFVWSTFLENDPTLAQAWRAVKRRIAEQAERCCEVQMERAPGLDLPGWRVLASGLWSSLLTEGPLAHLLESEEGP